MHRASLALGPIEIAFCRLFGGGAVLALWWWFAECGKVDLRLLPRIAVLALFANSMPFAIQPLLMARGFGHSFFGMMVAFVPLLTLALSVPMLGVWPTRRQVIGVLGGLVALVMLLWEGQARGMSVDMLSLAFCVPLAYAAGNTYIRRSLSGVPAIPLTAAICLCGAAWLLPLMLLPDVLQPLGLSGPTEPQQWPTAITGTAWLAIVGTGLSIALLVRLLQAYGPLYASMASYLVPLIALIWGAYDSEPITPRQLAAIVTVLAMVALVQTEVRAAVGSTADAASEVGNRVAPASTADGAEQPSAPCTANEWR